MGGLQSTDGGYRVIPGADVIATKLTQIADAASKDAEDLLPSVIQFSCAVYYAEESEEYMMIEIVRLGNSSGEATCDYETQDSSAKAGVKYEACSGTLVFAPQESTKEIRIRLLNDDAWDATLEFGVAITRVSGAQLGKYLNVCRIKIIDDDVFPTNKYEDCLRQHKEHEVPGAGLMWEYLQMAMRNQAIRADSIKQVLIDQMHGVYFILILYLQMYLVDVVLAPAAAPSNESDDDEDQNGRLLKQAIHVGGRMLASALQSSNDGDTSHEDDRARLNTGGLLVPGHRRETTIVIGAMWIVPFAILHLIDLWKCYLRIPGLARKQLQGNLLRRFLHYREDIHALRGKDNSDITMAIVRDVREVVDCGFMKMLEVLRILGKLGCATVFIVAENKMAVIPLIVFPFVLSFFLCCRERKTLDSNDYKAAMQDRVVGTVNDAILNYRIIADFSMRPLIIDAYEDSIDQFNDSESIACAVITNNSYAAPWLTTLSVGLYVVFGAYQVSSGLHPLSLGTFLATIHVFKDVGSEMKEIYGEALEIQRAFGPLRKICHFMNLETDLPERLNINRMRRKHGEEMRQTLRKLSKDADPLEFPVDKVDIEIKDLSFHYGATAAPIMTAVNLKFAQGNLYAFVGPPHEGKSTLLKLLGQVLLPRSNGGYIFIPPHLRVLHVSQLSTILKGSLVTNLTLDMDMETMGGPERVIKICKRVGFAPSLMRMLEENFAMLASEAAGVSSDHTAAQPAPCATEYEDHAPWSVRFSDTDHARLTLARVFVMNPECVVYHKPASAFNEYEAKGIVRCIREYVDERGLELPFRTRPYRRPRTLFFTSSTLAGVKEADCVYRVCAEGIWPILADNLDDRLLQ